MSYTQVCIHYVWTTHDRRPKLVMPLRQLLFDHIRQNALVKGIYLDRINGHLEHVHCLVWLKPKQTIDQVAQLLKGESSYWFNNLSGIESSKLRWQENYFAVSVSLHMLDTVRQYIDNQESHHRQMTFKEEYDELMRKYLFVKDLENSLAIFKLNTGR
jgi:putative transposase